MEILMFLIFLVSDLIVVLLCKYSYGKKWEYREGMMLGVHIPATCVRHPEVEKICKKTERDWNRFHRVNLIVSLALCLLCFADIILFMILWTLWLLEYMAGLEYLVIVPHRRMYRLKVREGWTDERSRKIVRIDTAVSAAAGKLALDWKWHLPILALTGLSGFLNVGAARRFAVGTEEAWPFWLLYAAGVGICLLFLVVHVGIARHPNRVYSENTDINLAANQIVKRSWTEGLVYGSWLNGIAWIYLAISYYWYGLDMSWLSLGIYTVLLLASIAALIVPVALSVGKRREVLEADTSACYIDDDEYWKKGWYNNPDDPHILVQDRFNSMNLSLNYGRPAAKVFTIVMAAVVAGVLIWTATILAEFVNVEVVFSREGDSWSFEAAGYDCTFTADEIRSVRLIDALPDESFTRTNGGSTEKYNVGYFRGRETGKCMMFLYNDSSPLLEIRLDDMTVFANSDRGETTKEWYESLQKSCRGTVHTAG